MAQRLFLHVGTPKSATTYLQGVLWKNRDRLAAQGVHLPLEGRRDHNQAAGDLTGGAVRQMPGREATTWEDMVAGIEAVEGTAVISEEMLANLRDSGYQRIVESLGGVELHIVVTSRDPIRQVPSLWQQSLKHRLTWDLDEFADSVSDGEYDVWERQQRIAGLLQRWAAHVPVERIHLVTVPQSGAAPDLIWDRFASVIGVDPEGFEAPDELVNTTLDSVQAEVLRQVNLLLAGRLGFPDPYVSVVRLKMVPALAEHGGNAKIVIPEKLLPWAADFSRQSIKEIEELGVDVVGDLEELVGVAPASAAHAAPDPERIREIALATLADMCVATSDSALDFLEMRTRYQRARRRHEKQRERADRLQQRLDELESRSPRTRARNLAARVRRRLR